MCPVCAFRYYVKYRPALRKADRLFVCHGSQTRGVSLSAQWLACWICNAMHRTYGVAGRLPLEGCDYWVSVSLSAWSRGPMSGTA